MKILFIGDIVGKLGRQAVAKAWSEIKKKHDPDLIIANAENATHGNALGINAYHELKKIGINFFTLGDHAFKTKENLELLNQSNPDVIRPANYPPNVPGLGSQIIEVGSKKILIINLIGRVFMKFDYDCPFRALSEILKSHEGEKLAAIIVDFHAEATSEKNALARYFDGSVSAIFGTHTHIPTCDDQILPKGTAFVSDAGMVGAKNSVIGVKIEPIIKMFLHQYKMPFEPAESGPAVFNSVLVEIDPKTRLAKKIIRLDKKVEV